jgi:thiamine biosynthesis lipoprotein ApbE
MHQQTWTAMGCQAILSVDTVRTPHELPFTQVAVWLQQWQQAIDHAHPQSEIARINAATGRAVRVSGAVWNVLRSAVQGAELSGGLVHPLFLASALTQLEAQAATPQPDWRAIQLDPFTSSVTIPPGTALDICYLLRPWAATQLARNFATYGAAMADIGGIVALSGPMANGSAWPIAIMHPAEHSRQLAKLQLRTGAAVNYSPAAYRKPTSDRVSPAPQDTAASDAVSVTVIAQDAIIGMVVAKTLYLLGSTAGLAWIESRPAFEALIFTTAGQILVSRRM